MPTHRIAGRGRRLDVNAREEAARTVEIDERAFTDLFLHLDRSYIPAADCRPILSGDG
jgi:hypothetical protein